jgi:hypothetical protein
VRAQAVHHLHLARGEARELVLPLVLERGRAYDQHALHAEVARKELRRGDRLHRLAQAHLVADQRAAGARGEQRAFGLVGIELDLQQLRQPLVGRTLGVGLGQRALAALAVAQPGDEGQTSS